MPVRYLVVEALRSPNEPTESGARGVALRRCGHDVSIRTGGGREPWSATTVVDAQAPPGNKALADLGTQLLDTIDDLHRLVV
ncbi:MAG: hypothetical protein CMF24_04420 [Ilumatobacter sp.]|nr:hypothetical protein [Ilumatobacter sp.]